jgi:hypothetical protein
MLGLGLHRLVPLRGSGDVFGKKTEQDRRKGRVRQPEQEHPMHLMTVDPRALKENPDRARQTKSNPQADALMLATIKAVGIVQP